MKNETTGRPAGGAAPAVDRTGLGAFTDVVDEAAGGEREHVALLRFDLDLSPAALVLPQQLFHVPLVQPRHLQQLAEPVLDHFHAVNEPLPVVLGRASAGLAGALMSPRQLLDDLQAHI